MRLVDVVARGMKLPAKALSSRRSRASVTREVRPHPPQRHHDVTEPNHYPLIVLTTPHEDPCGRARRRSRSTRPCRCSRLIDLANSAV